MRIIPAIDVIDGKCVRLSQGDYTRKKIYNESPLEVAKEFEANGIKYLHLVDLDGAKTDKIVNWRVLNQIATETNLQIDFGGGIKSTESLEIAFENGAKQITGGTIAVKNPSLFQLWINEYGAEKIILGADSNKGSVAIAGWEEDSEQELISFITNYKSNGIKTVICTDIAKDGMLNGTSNELYSQILTALPEINLIASGGVTCIGDIEEVRKIGCEGVIIGKAIYENKITLKELLPYVD
ncbi:MAG: phosphoribosylformimino-5-aminoimidazole carboxamide ribotide isomerase [Crocinitomix sp.]|jgi:phosphoribosylformimino-5-aminoimidazole carboxamide ribotide isomerase